MNLLTTNPFGDVKKDLRLLQSHQTSCRWFGSAFRGAERATRNNTEVAFAPYRFLTISSPPSARALVPLLSTGTILMESSTRRRKTRVGETAGSDGTAKKKKRKDKKEEKRFYCVSLMVFCLNQNEQVMEKAGCSRTPFGDVDERISFLFLFFLAWCETTDRQWRACVVTVGLHGGQTAPHSFMPHIKKKKEGHSSPSMKWC